jgi:type II secretory pathway component GspD/PulD (secretin)
MTAFTQTGSLIIADTGSNLRRIKSYVDMSVSRRKGDLVFKTYMLKNIDAEEAEFMLLSQFGMRQGVANVSSGAGGDRRGPPSPTPAPVASNAQLQVMSDIRTNSLFVTASPDQQTLVEEIIKAIDISELPDGTKLTREGNSGPYLRVYRVSGRADQVAQSITAMMPGVVVNEDGAAGTVHIFGTSRQHQQVEEWVKSFSEGTGASGSVAVIPLAKMDPLTAAATLRNLFVAEGANAPTVETDLYGNRIIVKGTALQVEQIKQVLADLGEDGTGLKKKGEGGNIRRYSLRGRDPEEFFKYLEEEWQASEKTSIRIVVPKKSGPIKGIKTPSDEVPAAEDEPAAAEKEDSTTQAPSRRPGLRKATGYLPVTRAVDEPAAVADPPESPLRNKLETVPPEAAERRESTTPDGIQIVVDGDELLLLSRDEDALDRLEETMDFLQQSIPFRTKWTVFYLQAADATEAAALLEQFIPSSSVTNTASSSSFGLSSMFSPLTQSVSDMTGLSSLGANPQTLRIIPDPRSNSLFVTGPQASVEEAEGFLEVLDSNNIPESLRDMQPRRIEVEYAEIDDIATMVNETFKPYMEPAGGRQQQNNPLAQMFGGGGGNGKSNEPQGVQMTVAVDRQTSSLVISSSEALFTKVQEMVKEADEASKKSNRTIRVVQLKNSDASMIQESLRSLFPRVTTSATRPSSSSTNSSNSGNTNNPQPPQTQQPQTDPFQQMIQDRMRQRGGDTGRGGTSPFGGGNFTPFGGGNFGGRGGGTNGGRGGR